MPTITSDEFDLDIRLTALDAPQVFQPAATERTSNPTHHDPCCTDYCCTYFC